MTNFINDPFFFDPEKYHFKHQYATCVGQGLGFGEHGVLKNLPRSATAFSKGNTILIGLDAGNYRKILSQEQIKKMEKKVRFFKEYLLKDQAYSEQVKIVNYFQKSHRKKRDVIFFEGDSVKSLVLIKHGKIELTKIAQYDALNLIKVESNPNQRKYIKIGAFEHFDISNNSKWSQKITQVEDGDVLSDWVIDGKNNFEQLYKATVVSEEAALWE